MCHKHQYIDFTKPGNPYFYETISCLRFNKEWADICQHVPVYPLWKGKECPKGCPRDERTIVDILFPPVPKEAEQKSKNADGAGKESEGVDRTTKGKRKRDSGCCMC